MRKTWIRASKVCHWFNTWKCTQNCCGREPRNVSFGTSKHNVSCEASYETGWWKLHTHTYVIMQDSHAKSCVFVTLPCKEWIPNILIHVYVYIYMYTHTYTHIYKQANTHTHTHAPQFALFNDILSIQNAASHMRSRVSVCVYAYKYTFTCMHTCTHLHVHAHKQKCRDSSVQYAPAWSCMARSWARAWRWAWRPQCTAANKCMSQDPWLGWR